MSSHSQHSPSTDRDIIEEKPGLTHTVSAGAISISPELFEKVRYSKCWHTVIAVKNLIKD